MASPYHKQVAESYIRINDHLMTNIVATSDRIF